MQVMFLCANMARHKQTQILFIVFSLHLRSRAEMCMLAVHNGDGVNLFTKYLRNLETSTPVQRKF